MQGALGHVWQYVPNLIFSATALYEGRRHLTWPLMTCSWFPQGNLTLKATLFAIFKWALPIEQVSYIPARFCGLAKPSQFIIA